MRPAASRADGSRMGTAEAAATTKAGSRAGAQGSPHNHQCPSLAACRGSSLARLAGAIWTMAHGCNTLLSMAALRLMATFDGQVAVPGRCQGRLGLGRAHGGQSQRAGTPPRSRGKRLSPRALGRSRGGFGSKLHLRCDRRGDPMAFVLTAGERNERTALPELMR